VNEINKNVMVGYKVFNPDWTCDGFKYEVGKAYISQAYPSYLLEKGICFSRKLKDCFKNHPLDSRYKVVRIIAFGDVAKCLENNDSSSYTNKIYIAEELGWDEVLRIVSHEKGNMTFENNGSWNAGHWNAAHYSSNVLEIPNFDAGILEKMMEKSLKF